MHDAEPLCGKKKLNPQTLENVTAAQPTNRQRNMATAQNDQQMLNGRQNLRHGR